MGTGSTHVRFDHDDAEIRVTGARTGFFFYGK